MKQFYMTNKIQKLASSMLVLFGFDGFSNGRTSTSENHSVSADRSLIQGGIAKSLAFLAVLFFSSIAMNAQVSVVGTTAGTTPGSFATLNAAFTAINAGTYKGVVSVTITGNTTEPATAVPLLKSGSAGGSSYTSISIKPSGGNWTINSAAAPTASKGIIILQGADNVTIDGDDTATAGTQNLSFVVATNTSTGTAAIQLASNSITGTDGADNNTVKNCIITGGRSSVSSTTTSYGIVMCDISAISTGAYSSLNTLIQNNLITRAYHGVYANGSSATYPNTGIQILNNTMGSATSANNIGSRGILISYSTAATGTGALIQGNDIRVGDYGTSGYASTLAAIEIGTSNYGVKVLGNNLHDIAQPSTSGYGSIGVYVTGSTNNTLGYIQNNIIRDLTASNYSTSVGTLYEPNGIYFSAGATNYNIDFNTIVLKTANPSGSTTPPFSSCINVSASAVTISSLRNNIFVNSNSSTNAYGVYTTATGNISAGTINYNDYYVPTGKIGYYGATSYSTLASWKTATSKEANGINVNPSFLSSTDMHIDINNVNASNLDAKGTAISGLTTDFDGDTRNASTPDIGADEFTIPTVSVPTITSFTPSTICIQGGQTVTITGTNFAIITAVKFNGVNATSYTVVNSTTITAVFPAGATDGTITVTNSAGTATSGSSYTAAPTPTNTVSSSVTICSGTSTTLTASGASTYVWSPSTGLSATTGDTVSANPTSTTVYSVLGTSAAGCVGNSATVTVTVNQTPSAISIATPAAFCSGTVGTLAATGGTVLSSATGTLGAGASTTASSGTSSGNSVSPFSHYYGGYKAQYIIRASELTALGLSTGSSLKSLAFDVTTAGITYTGFTLSLGKTSATAATSTFDTAALTQVYTGNLAVSTTGLNTLTFGTGSGSSASYTWDGTSSIVVNLCWSNNNGGGTAAEVKYDATSFVAMSYYRVDSTAPATVCGATTSTSQSFRPKMVFAFTANGQAAITWTPTTDLYTNLAGTTAYTGTAATTVYTKTLGSQTYTATATNGSCTSTNSITVAPVALPTVTTSGDVALCNGGTVSLTANGATTYVWSPATGLSATTGSSVSANPTTTTTYTVTGTASGCSNTATATVTVNNPVAITTHPSNSVILEGADATFTVAATGTGLTYQWQVNDGSGFANISGANSASYTVTAAAATLTGYQYQCVVSGLAPCAPVTTNAATLTVGSVSITAQPSAQTVCSNTNAVYTIATSGEVTSYQWQVSTDNGASWSDVSDATLSSLTLTSLTSANTGAKYRCVLNGGAVTSNAAALTVYDAIAIGTQPVSQTVCSNVASVSFTAAATGSGVTYQWQKSTDAGATFSNVSGATAATYTITAPSITLNGTQYQVVVSGTSPCSAVTSNAVTLTVNQVVAITTQPTAVTQCPSVATASFTVAATGTGLTYQWVSTIAGSDSNLTDGTDFTGANTASLTVNTPSTYTGATFKCIITGTAPCAAVTSNAVALTVTPNFGGTYTVGTGGNYATLTAAVAAYNAATCFSGNVVFSLTDASYSASETFPIVVNSNNNAGSYTLTIAPASGNNATITGSSASAILKLNGADNVIINGSNNGSTSRNLTIVNSNTSTTSAVVWLASIASPANGATNNTVKNAVITGNGTSTTIAGIITSGATITAVADAPNSGNTFQNNLITTSYYGVAMSGPATGDSNNSVLNNTIGSTVAANKIGYEGIFSNNQTNVAVNSNTIFGITNAGSSTTNIAGILVSGLTTNGVVSNNTISDVKCTGARSAYGIMLAATNATTGITLANNVVFDVNCSSTNATLTRGGHGMAILTGGGYKIYNNTINLNTSNSASSSTGVSAALYVASGVTTLDVRNNIFANTQTLTTRYAIYDATATNAAYTTLDYNNYYSAGTALGYLASARTALADIVTGFGQNAHSTAIAPNFISTTNMHMALGSNLTLDNTGTPIAAVTTDIDGDTRSASTPDMGADEFSTLYCDTASAGTVAASVASLCTSGTSAISANGYSIGLGTTYQWQSATDSAFTTPVNVGSALTTYAGISTGTITATTYYRLAVTCNAGATVYSTPVAVVVNTPATLTVSAAASICAGQSSTLTANGAATYTWSPATGLSATTGASVVATPSASTTYTVNGVDANGCTVTAKTIAVTVNPYPSALSIAQGSSSVCAGTAVSLTATGGALNSSFINESFSSATLPTVWVASPGSGDTVAIATTNVAGGTANEVKITGNSMSTSIIDRLYYGPFNSVGNTSLVLTWKNFLSHYSSSYAYGVKVQTSTDGVNWHDSSWVTNPVTASMAASTQTVTLNNSDIGSATLYVW